MNTLHNRRSQSISGRAERRGCHPDPLDRINHDCVRREVGMGVSQHALPVGAVLDVRTQHRVYRIVNREGGKLMIAGHPEYCPRPVLVQLHGSTWGGSMIKRSYIGKGMCLEFRHPVHGVIVTSPIEEILERSGSGIEGKR